MDTLVFRDQASEYPVRTCLLGQTKSSWTIDLRDGRLAAVNFLLGCVGVTQVTRILLYQQSLKDKPVEQIVGDDAKDVVDTAKGVVKSPDAAAKKAVN